MPVVTGISSYRGIVSLQADGLVIARIREKDFRKFPLAEGDAFDDEAYMDRIAAAQMKDACAGALHALEVSEKTKAELTKLLLRKGFVPAAVEAAVERAAEYRFVDDKRMAARMAEKSTSSGIGIYQLKQKMRAKGISDEDAEEALSVIGEEDQIASCRKVFEKIRHKYEDMPQREAKGKASQALARRGFSWGTISSVLENAFDEDWDD